MSTKTNNGATGSTTPLGDFDLRRWGDEAVMTEGERDEWRRRHAKAAPARATGRLPKADEATAPPSVKEFFAAQTAFAGAASFGVVIGAVAAVAAAGLALSADASDSWRVDAGVVICFGTKVAAFGYLSGAWWAAPVREQNLGYANFSAPRCGACDRESAELPLHCCLGRCAGEPACPDAGLMAARTFWTAKVHDLYRRHGDAASRSALAGAPPFSYRRLALMLGRAHGVDLRESSPSRRTHT